MHCDLRAGRAIALYLGNVCARPMTKFALDPVGQFSGDLAARRAPARVPRAVNVVDGLAIGAKKLVGWDDLGARRFGFGDKKICWEKRRVVWKGGGKRGASLECLVERLVAYTKQLCGFDLINWG